jgi:hypothetical protein
MSVEVRGHVHLGAQGLHELALAQRVVVRRIAVAQRVHRSRLLGLVHLLVPLDRCATNTFAPSRSRARQKKYKNIKYKIAKNKATKIGTAFVEVGDGVVHVHQHDQRSRCDRPLRLHFLTFSVV